MSERTPQDVLREAAEQALDRMTTAFDLLGPDMTDEEREKLAQTLWFGKEELDKAIAEAPDSPRCDFDCDACNDPEPPDTLSEKHGLDVERLQRIAKAADFHASVKFDKGWHGPDLLDGIAAWMDRSDDERGQPDHSVQTDMRRWAKELRAALGSTDSEGR